MRRPKVLVLYAPGNNCHHELLDAFRIAGADPELVLLTADLLRGRRTLSEGDMLAIPGGFSFGDHIAAGRIFAIDLIHRLKDQLREARERGVPMIGICNGFQILVNTGLLPGGGEIGFPDALVDRNASAVFESRWVDLYVQKSGCLWTKGLAGERMRVPVAHGEGRVILPDTYDDRQTVFRYGAPEGSEDYPANPNGSRDGIAGICDQSGLILGLMPHPERAIYPWLGNDDGIRIFRAGVDAVR
ncbi:phosphoribosylformylglycinamidine synthase I [bacterium]|nr:phosphoribosylformylglycinamidine synthase I [bacterium]